MRSMVEGALRKHRRLRNAPSTTLCERGPPPRERGGPQRSTIPDALDIGAHCAQLLLQPLVPAVEVVHARHRRLALRR